MFFADKKPSRPPRPKPRPDSLGVDPLDPHRELKIRKNPLTSLPDTLCQLSGLELPGMNRLAIPMDDQNDRFLRVGHIGRLSRKPEERAWEGSTGKKNNGGSRSGGLREFTLERLYAECWTDWWADQIWYAKCGVLLTLCVVDRRWI